jgi:hypothetical protein
MTSKFSFNGITLDNYISSVTSDALVSTKFNFGISNVNSVFNSVVVENPTKTGYSISGTDVANFCIAKYTEYTGSSDNIVIPTWCNKIRAVLVGYGGSGGTSVVTTVPGNTIAGNTVPGNAIAGNTVPGNTVPGNTVPGNTVPGNTNPVVPAANKERTDIQKVGSWPPYGPLPPGIVSNPTNRQQQYYTYGPKDGGGPYNYQNPGADGSIFVQAPFNYAVLHYNNIYVTTPASGGTTNPTTTNPTNYNPTNYNPTTTNPTTYNPTTTNPTTYNPITYNYAAGGGGGGGAFYYLNTTDITNTRNINLAISTANTVLTVGTNVNYTAAAGNSASESTVGNAGSGTYTGNAGSGATGGTSGLNTYTNSSTLQGYGMGGSGGQAPTSGTSTNSGNAGSTGYCRIYFLSN